MTTLSHDFNQASTENRTVLISGASGLVGSAFVKFLSARGYTVLTLVRKATQNPLEIYWDPERAQIDLNRIEKIPFIVHLSGASIDQRWTKKAKQRIVTSRVQSTQFLVETMAKLQEKPKHFLCASAVGYYGASTKAPHDEHGEGGSGFLASVCKEWEASALRAKDLGVEVTNFRLGVVLTPSGGMLKKILPIFRLGLAGRIGSGDQMLSWISLEDAVSAITYLMEKGITGPVNLVSPYAETNASFTKKLARILRRPALFPVPSFVVRMIFGEMGTETALGDTHAVPGKLLESGFTFKHSHLEEYLKGVLSK